MGLRKTWRRVKRNKVGRVLVAGATLGVSEQHRIRKKVIGAIKKNPELVGAGVGLAFGAPMLGASIGSQFGSARSRTFPSEYSSDFGSDYSSDFGSDYSSSQMPEQAEEPSSSNEIESPGGFAPALDKKWLVIGGIALLAIIFLTKKST